jgi:hypothetical protein
VPRFKAFINAAEYQLPRNACSMLDRVPRLGVDGRSALLYALFVCCGRH